jgi:dephospho-CoA kinase
VRVARLVEHRGMSPADAAARVQVQLRAALKRPRADLTLANDGTPASLEAQVAQVWAQLALWAA